MFNMHCAIDFGRYLGRWCVGNFRGTLEDLKQTSARHPGSLEKIDDKTRDAKRRHYHVDEHKEGDEVADGETAVKHLAAAVPQNSQRADCR